MSGVEKVVVVRQEGQSQSAQEEIEQHQEEILRGREKGQEDLLKAFDIPSANPYDQKTAEAIRKFYRIRSRRNGLELAKIGEDGVLQLYKKDKSLESTIVLKKYRPLKDDERKEMEDDRIQKLIDLDREFEEKKVILRQAIEAYKETGAVNPVLIANAEVEKVELKRVAVRSPIRSTRQIPAPVANQVLFDQPYETRKLFAAKSLFDKDLLRDGIIQLERRNFPNSLFYGRYEDVPGAGSVLETKKDGRLRLTTGAFARILSDPDDPVNGLFTPLHTAEFVYKGTQYSSAFQAYEAERMAEQGQEQIRKALLRTRSYRTIRALTKKIMGQVKDSRTTWTSILTELYKQNPVEAAALAATGQDVFVYADPVIGAGGIGMDPTNKSLLDPTKWPSKNVVGEVLATIRATYREQGPVVAPPPVVAEAVISVEEQGAAKKGAIINARRYR